METKAEASGAPVTCRSQRLCVPAARRGCAGSCEGGSQSPTGKTQPLIQQRYSGEVGRCPSESHAFSQVGVSQSTTKKKPIRPGRFPMVTQGGGEQTDKGAQESCLEGFRWHRDWSAAASGPQAPSSSHHASSSCFPTSAGLGLTYVLWWNFNFMSPSTLTHSAQQSALWRAFALNS